jgi:hypothetical protein
VIRENIFQMYTRIGGAGFFVKRDSWSHPHTVARVVSVGGLTAGPLPGRAPYYTDAAKKRSPTVMAEISYQGTAPRLEELPCPGTFAYRVMEDTPERWLR